MQHLTLELSRDDWQQVLLPKDFQPFAITLQMAVVTLHYLAPVGVELQTRTIRLYRPGQELPNAVFRDWEYLGLAYQDQQTDYIYLKPL